MLTLARVSALCVQDVVRRFVDLHQNDWDLFPEKVRAHSQV